MQISIDTLIVTVSGTVITSLFGVAVAYFRSINKELVDQRVRAAEQKVTADNHNSQLRDIWSKLSEIDKHLESTDRRLTEVRSKQGL